MSDVEDTFRELIDQFHQKMKDEPDTKAKLKGKEVRMEVDVQGDSIYRIHLKDGDIVDFGQGNIKDRTALVTMSLETFQALQSGELSAMKAFMTKKIAFEGSMSDLMLMRGVLIGE